MILGNFHGKFELLWGEMRHILWAWTRFRQIVALKLAETFGIAAKSLLRLGKECSSELNFKL